MTLRSSTHAYGSVAVAIYWLSAILTLVILASGFRTDAAAGDTARIMALRIHVPTGIAVLLLTLARIT